MKTKEEILKECGFIVTVHEEEIGLVTTAFIEPFMKAMESYASQRIEKYRELIEWLNDECPAVSPPLEPYTTADLSHDFAEILRSKLDDLKKN